MLPRNELKDSISKYENQTGKFSTYACAGGVAGQDIPFEKKPAQQFLSELGCSNDKLLPLTQPGKKTESKNVTIKGFTKNTKSKLTITKDRVDELRTSAKVYTNPEIISAATYKQAAGKLKPQDKGKSNDGAAWQNLAAGICHAQKIDLLVEQSLSPDGKAITAEKSGKMEKGMAAITLLSTPALNFAYGAAKDMPAATAEHYIKNMYRLIFSAAVDSKCTHITLPAAGLGVFGGNPDLYFKCLFDAAKEYPELKIIYNPAKNTEQFSRALSAYENQGGVNVVATDRDVLFLADQMARDGINCAMHNPSDADVVYGAHDVGQFWKNGIGDGYVGEEHIGAMSTAPLNSRGLNPDVYNNPIELRPRIANEAVNQQQPVAPQPAAASHTTWQKAKASTTSLFHNMPAKPANIPQQPNNDYIVTPALAQLLYEAATLKAGRDPFAGLNNTYNPDKFSKALEILDIKTSDIQFNNNNGYKIATSANEFARLLEISENREMIVSPEMAAKLYRIITVSGHGGKIQTLNNELRPEKFAKALEIIGVQAKEIGFYQGTNGYTVKVDKDNYIKLQGMLTPATPEQKPASPQKRL